MRKTDSWVLRCAVIGLSALFVCGVAGIIGGSRTALATPGSMFFGTTLAKALFIENIAVKTHEHDKSDHHKVEIRTKGMSDVYYVHNTVPPGGHSGWHSHPGPSVVAVKSGVATVYSGDDPTCTPQFVPAGMGFVDPGEPHVHMVRNEAGVELETVAFQIVPAGASRRIDAPSPGNCPF